MNIQGKPKNLREYPTRPVVGVGAVVVRGARVLLVRRGSEPSYGLWSLPGGEVELGEELKAAVAREVKEECGIDVEPGEVALVLDRIVRDDAGQVRYHFVLIDFFARVVGGDLRPGTDALDARWVAWEEMEHYELSEGLRAILPVLRQQAHMRPSADA